MKPTFAGPSRVIGCEIIAALVKGQRTISELREMVGVSEVSIRHWLRDLQSSGLVRVAEYRARPKNRETGHIQAGRRSAVYEWQAVPFARTDVTTKNPSRACAFSEGE